MGNFFRKIISITIVFSFIFGLSSGIFIQKASAAEDEKSGATGASPGAVMGQALAAGAACFLAGKVEAWVAGILTRLTALPEGHLKKVTYITNVPTAGPEGAESGMSTETSGALALAKNCIRDYLAKIMLDWITDETVAWIQGKGKPAFVQDWGKFSKDAFNAGVGEFIRQSPVGFLCSPFRVQASLTLQPVQKFYKQIGCTLDKVVENIDDFYKDFKKGKWIALNTAWQPNNNYFGSVMLLHDQSLMQGTATKEALSKEALSGKGFLSQKKCVEVDFTKITAEDKAKADKNCKGASDKIEKSYNEKYGKCLDGCDKHPEDSPDYKKCAQVCENTYGAAVTVGVIMNTELNCEKEKIGEIAINKGEGACKKEEIITPGDTVGQAAGQLVKNDAIWAANIKSWVATLINAAFNRLIREGVAYMSNSKATSPDIELSGTPFGTYDAWDAVTQGVKETYSKDKIDNLKKISENLSKAITLQKESQELNEKMIQVLSNLKKKSDCPQEGVLHAAKNTLDDEIKNLTTTNKNVAEIISKNTDSLNKVNQLATEGENIIASQKAGRDTRMLFFIEKYDAWLQGDGKDVFTNNISGNLTQKWQEQVESDKKDLESLEAKCAACGCMPSTPAPSQ